jgi:hypothetical protein
MRFSFTPEIGHTALFTHQLNHQAIPGFDARTHSYAPFCIALCKKRRFAESMRHFFRIKSVIYKFGIGFAIPPLTKSFTQPETMQ